MHKPTRNQRPRLDSQGITKQHKPRKPASFDSNDVAAALDEWFAHKQPANQRRNKHR
jgi:hypothetical protein